MTLSLLLFIGIAVALVLLLAWVARPPGAAPLTPEAALEALSEERHYARLPQILQALRGDDTEFMRDRGHAELMEQLRRERKQIALRYLDYLQMEFRVLLECSRILATMAPELTVKGEFDRLRQHVAFLWNCQSLRWRLRMDLQPWDAFGTISDKAGTMTLQLEAATARIGERALLANDVSLIPDYRRDHAE
jgi:hypothetical protein